MSRRPADPAERRRRRKFFRATGISGRPENTPLRAHLSELAERISIAEISRRSGVPEATIWYQLNADQKRCYIPTLNALMGVRLTSADLDKLSQEERMYGAHRIVQGLAALGWTGEAIGEACGLTAHMIRAMGRQPKPRHLNQTGEQTYRALLLGAQKLERLDPVADGGIPAQVCKSTRARARGRGSAPLGCWDLSTVHDKTVEPEWTGECGTLSGYRIHVREGIPVCPRCGAAKRDQQGNLEAAFSPEKFREVRLRAGFAQKPLEEAAHLSRGVITKWERGVNAPTRHALQQVLSVLDATFGDVTESEET